MIADEGQLVDAAAVGTKLLPSRNRLRAMARPSTPANRYAAETIILRLVVIGARQGRVDPHGTVIIGQFKSEAHHRPRIRIVVDIADRPAQMRIDIEGQAQNLARDIGAPAAFVDQDKAGLVLELRVPALGCGKPPNFVNECLGLLGQRSRADHSELQLQLVELLSVVGNQTDRAVQKARIRPFVQRRVDQIGSRRCVDVLAQRVAGDHRAAGRKERHRWRAARTTQSGVSSGAVV